MTRGERLKPSPAEARSSVHSLAPASRSRAPLKGGPGETRSSECTRPNLTFGISPPDPGPRILRADTVPPTLGIHTLPRPEDRAISVQLREGGVRHAD